jgi:membrane-bound lytic murein transglycosylase MltF
VSVVRINPVSAFASLILISTYLSASSSEATPQSQTKQQSAIATSKTNAAQSTSSLELPVTFERQVGDLDGMLKRRQIRVLVIPSRSGFFYDKGQPHGVYYEAFDEFQRFVNNKYKSGSLKINVTYLPVRIEQLEQALLQGMGDVIGFPLIVTPEREQVALFTAPIHPNVKQVIVTGPKLSQITTLENLGGKEVYANPLTVYYENLQRLSDSLQKAGKPPILVKAADPNLNDEDMLEMVNAGLIPATVTINVRANFWAQIFTHLIVHHDIVVKEEGQLAWATRKDSPHLRELLDEFIRGHAVGTSFGNTLARRYTQSTKWVKDSTSTEEMAKFQAYVRYFQKYAAEYNFDYLMLVAQGYQESLLDQGRKNPSGAVGIMQVIPKNAAAPPINIPNVDIAQYNIEAGAKMLRNIADTYFNDPKLDALNKTLMVFASYNAGPNRIARLRKQALTEGLDPNQWFGNVELVVAKDIGQETVQYVSNIYKYYVAYKLTLEQSHSQTNSRPD